MLLCGQVYLLVLAMTLMINLSPSVEGDTEFTRDYGVILREISTTYIPRDYSFSSREKDGAVYTFDTDAKPLRMAHDKYRGVLYVAGDGYIHYYRINQDVPPQNLGHTSSTAGFSLVDIAVCGDHVIVLGVNDAERQSRCDIYTTFNPFSNVNQALFRKGGFKVPDIGRSMVVTSECNRLVITTEGRAYGEGRLFRDPPPAVMVLNLPPDLRAISEEELSALVKVNDFSALNNRAEFLQRSGVRFPMKWRGESFNQDLDPTKTVVDEDNGRIYVTLQTNNAIAELDIETLDLLRVKSLGLKDWTNLALDPSDMPKERSFDRYPISSYYQPSDVKLLRRSDVTNKLNGNSDVTYLVTSDQGSHRDYSALINWTEVVRGRDIVTSGQFVGNLSDALFDDLHNDTRLGRMEFTKVTDSSGLTTEYQGPIAFGGRGISILRASDLSRVYDSDSLLELYHAQITPEFFNYKVMGKEYRLFSGKDKTSPGKGTEPSVLEIGQERGLTMLFIGSANPGSVSVFSVPDPEMAEPAFETLWSGIPDDEMTLLLRWNDTYNWRRVSGVGVSDILFLPSSTQSNRKAKIAVTGSASRTLTLLEVQVKGRIPGNSAKCQRLQTVSLALLLSLSLCIFIGGEP